MEEFMDLQIGDEISFQKINPMKKGILLNKRYCIKDIFNINEYSSDIQEHHKCIAFIGENKRRVVIRNNVKWFSQNYKIVTHFCKEKRKSYLIKENMVKSAINSLSELYKYRNTPSLQNWKKCADLIRSI